MRRLVPWLAICACTHAPPPKPPAAELPVKAVSDVQGRWVTDDEMDWGYSLSIAPDGALSLVIDRGKMGRCEAIGKLEPLGPSRFRVTYGRNDCDRTDANTARDLEVPSFTGDALTVVIGTARRTYHRAPS